VAQQLCPFRRTSVCCVNTVWEPQHYTITDTLVKNEMFIKIFCGFLRSYRRTEGQQTYLDLPSTSFPQNSSFVITLSSSPQFTSPMKMKQRCKINIMTAVHFPKLLHSKAILSVQKQTTCNGREDYVKSLMVT